MKTVHSVSNTPFISHIPIAYTMFVTVSKIRVTPNLTVRKVNFDSLTFCQVHHTYPACRRGTLYDRAHTERILVAKVLVVSNICDLGV